MIGVVNAVLNSDAGSGLAVSLDQLRPDIAAASAATATAATGACRS